ncbi:MAG: hypothetical protein ABIK65_08110 [Candidatus Eisenbacteria bacterium]
MKRTALLTVLFCLAAAPPAKASYFGQNKVRYHDREWRVLETAHFRIHFYREEEDLALETVALAEAIYEDLSARLDHEIARPVPVVLYGSHPEFQSTPITPYVIDEGTGGITEFLKRRVFLPYPGSREEFRHVLHHELVHAFQIDILDPEGTAGLNGTTVPLWMIEGMAEYLSRGGVDPFTRMWLRDSLLDGPPPSFSGLSRMGDVRIYRFGQAAWAWLASERGESSAGDFLRALALSRDAEKAMRMVFGREHEELSEEWADALRREYLPEVVRLNRAGRVAEPVDAEGRVNVGADLSPDGAELLVLSDREGGFGLYRDPVKAGGGKGRLLAREGGSGDLVSLRPYHGGGRWSPDGGLVALPAQGSGGDVIHVLDARSGDRIRTLRPGFEEIRGVSWSPDGSRLIAAGLADGRTDLYRVDGKTGEAAPLTADRFLYIHPDWSPDGNRVVCATDRIVDGEAAPPDRTLRIGVLDLRTGRWTVLPGQEGNNHSPVWSPEGNRILFVSDRAGTPDVYLHDLAAASVRRITRLEGGAAGLLSESPVLSWSRESGDFSFVSFRRQSWTVHVMPDPGYAPGDPSLPPGDLMGPALALASGTPPEGAGYLPPYRVLPYRARLTADVRAAGAGAGPDGGFSSGSSIYFSDLLGGHRMEVAFGIYGSMGNSDLFAAYKNRVGRTEYEASVFQFRRALVDWNGVRREALYRGLRFRLLYPLDRYRRFEWGGRIGEGNDEVLRDLGEGETSLFAGAEIAYVHDNARWSWHGPRRGRRLRLSLEPLVMEGEGGGWARVDARFYEPAGERVVIASRTVAGRSAGAGGPVFGLGFRSLVRGFPDLTDRERGYAVQSAEVRFPLVDALRLGWPFPITFGGIRGVLFADAGYFAGEERPRIAYGPGIRAFFGPFQLMLDFPQMSDGRRNLGPLSGYFRIGRDF